MPPNLSMFTEFGLFRNSNFVTTYVANYIYIFICCAFAGDSYQESKPGKEKHKSEVSGSYVYFYLSSQKQCQHSDYGKHVARYSI